jgi:hypothetical protein
MLSGYFSFKPQKKSQVDGKANKNKIQEKKE